MIAYNVHWFLVSREKIILGDYCFKNAKFEYLIDATIAYESEKEASLASWWFGAAQKVFIHWRVFKMDQELSEEEVKHTLYQIWAEKEILLKHRDLYGHFPQLEDKAEINGNLP